MGCCPRLRSPQRSRSKEHKKTPLTPPENSPEQTPTTPPPPLKERACNSRISPEEAPAVDRRTKPKLVRTSTEEDGYEPVGIQLEESSDVQHQTTSPRGKDQKEIAADTSKGE